MNRKLQSKKEAREAADWKKYKKVGGMSRLMARRANMYIMMKVKHGRERKFVYLSA